MNGERYYAFSKKNAKFFVLDSDYMDPKQLQWIDTELKNARDDWKIVYFHHPLYSSGGRHGSEVDLRVTLEPLFVKSGVNVVYSGHDHIYERIKPQKGIYYFVVGSSGQLRGGDLKKSALTEAGYDMDQTFMLNEIDKNELFFQAITRQGKTIDSGVIAPSAQTEADRHTFTIRKNRGERRDRKRKRFLCVLCDLPGFFCTLSSRKTDPHAGVDQSRVPTVDGLVWTK